MSAAGKYKVTGGDMHLGDGSVVHHGDEADLSEEDAKLALLGGGVVPVGAPPADPWLRVDGSPLSRAEFEVKARASFEAELSHEYARYLAAHTAPKATPQQEPAKPPPAAPAATPATSTTPDAKPSTDEPQKPRKG